MPATLDSRSEELARLARLAQCPSCRSNLDEDFTCEQGHRFDVVDGVPILVSGFDEEAASIRESFGREWSYFRHGIDRTWSQTVDERRGDFLRHIDLDPLELGGKLVFDAGCGNGMLSAAIGEFGCDVYACDLSPSVHYAARYFKDFPVTYLQANLMEPPIKPATFDVVYCAGVLHHTPSTRFTFDRVAETVAPGGRMFVWLYHRMPQMKQRLRRGLRSGVAMLPESARHGVAVAFAGKKVAVGAVTRKHRLNWQETLIATHDFWTPRYRWVHTQSELLGWFAHLGFADAHVTEVGPNGFGAVAVRG